MISKIISFIGDLYLHKFLMFILYKPTMHKLKGHEIRQILNVLELGDLIFRKHKGWISSSIIPGYWSHVAIYCGENKIIHAIGDGVLEEDILTYCRTDCISVQRIKNLSKDELSMAISLAESYVEAKIPYDFSFKDDNGKFYCTELINDIFDKKFIKEYTKIKNMNVLLLDELYNSFKLEKIIEFKH